jgi:hypothetical protein
VKTNDQGHQRFFHSLAFTSGDFRDVIQMKPRNARVTENACPFCHAEITLAHFLAAQPR